MNGGLEELKNTFAQNVSTKVKIFHEYKNINSRRDDAVFAHN